MTSSSDSRPPGARRFRLLGAVLAGGEGRRYGGDKTAAEVGGVPMLARAVEALRDACDDVVVVSSRTDTPEGPWPVIPDLRHGRGPLAGIETALSALAKKASDPGSTEVGGAGHRHDAVIVLAADMPLVGPQEVAHLVNGYTRADSRTMAVAAARRGTPPYEPLFALYSIACRVTVGRLLDEGRSAAGDLFAAVAGVTVEIGGDAASVNVNTPDDRELAEARFRAGTTATGAGADAKGAK